MLQTARAEVDLGTLTLWRWFSSWCIGEWFESAWCLIHCYDVLYVVSKKLAYSECTGCHTATRMVQQWIRGHHEMTFRGWGNHHVTERSAKFEFINPCWKAETYLFRKTTASLQLRKLLPSHHVFINCSGFAILVENRYCFQLPAPALASLISTKRWVNILVLRMKK